MQYPDNCIKGIPNSDFLLEDGKLVSASLFAFSKDPRNSDGWIEESVNWMDDEKALDFTLKQKKDGCPQFKVGAAILPRTAVDKINKLHSQTRPLSYEREPIENENPYHGNLLLRGDTGNPAKTMIRSLLAYACQIIPREDR